MKKRYIAAAAIPGIVIVFLGGGFGMEAHNGLTSISLPPLALLAWPFIVVAANSIELGDIEPTDAAASWLLKSVSFIYDFMFLFMLLFIPATFFALVGILGELPPPWFVDNAASPSSFLSTAFSIICFLAFWSGLGLALHPRVRTPGMVLCNIEIRAVNSPSVIKLSLLGVFSYYGVFIPIFNMFSYGIKVNGTVQNA